MSRLKVTREVLQQLDLRPLVDDSDVVAALRKMLKEHQGAPGLGLGGTKVSHSTHPGRQYALHPPRGTDLGRTERHAR